MSELSPQNLIEKYLSETFIMQLATSKDDQPWICSLHFVADEYSNIYWLSKQDRRHSQEVVNNSNVAIAIAVSTEQPVIGIQVEGTAKVLNDKAEIKEAVELYIDKHGTDKGFADTIIEGTNQHKLYKFTPRIFNLFDQVNFAGPYAQVWKPKD
jgi:uncharacterized protein YhbP (UPF0306 family)